MRHWWRVVLSHAKTFGRFEYFKVGPQVLSHVRGTWFRKKESKKSGGGFPDSQTAYVIDISTILLRALALPPSAPSTRRPFFPPKSKEGRCARRWVREHRRMIRCQWVTKKNTYTGGLEDIPGYANAYYNYKYVLLQKDNSRSTVTPPPSPYSTRHPNPT